LPRLTRIGSRSPAPSKLSPAIPCWWLSVSTRWMSSTRRRRNLDCLPLPLATRTKLPKPPLRCSQGKFADWKSPVPSAVMCQTFPKIGSALRRFSNRALAKSRMKPSPMMKWFIPFCIAVRKSPATRVPRSARKAQSSSTRWTFAKCLITFPSRLARSVSPARSASPSARGWRSRWWMSARSRLTPRW